MISSSVKVLSPARVPPGLPLPLPSLFSLLCTSARLCFLQSVMNSHRAPQTVCFSPLSPSSPITPPGTHKGTPPHHPTGRCIGVELTDSPQGLSQVRRAECYRPVSPRGPAKGGQSRERLQRNKQTPPQWRPAHLSSQRPHPHGVHGRLLCPSAAPGLGTAPCLGSPSTQGVGSARLSARLWSQPALGCNPGLTSDSRYRGQWSVGAAVPLRTVGPGSPGTEPDRNQELQHHQDQLVTVRSVPLPP